MKKFIPVLALFALPACFGVNDTTVTTARASVDPVMNRQLEATLAQSRMAGLNPILFETRTATAAQVHANDMVDGNYLSIIIPGRDSVPDDPNDAGSIGIQAWDMGDTLREDLGLDWNDIVQMVGAGDMTADQMLANWRAAGSPAGSGGGAAIDLTGTDTIAEFNFFGIAKAGTGANTKWALIVVDTD